MKNIIKHVVFVVPVLLVTTQAIAHPGHHKESSFSTVMQHILSSPYHVGLAIGVTFSLAFVVWKIWAKKPSRSNKNIN